MLNTAAAERAIRRIERDLERLIATDPAHADRIRAMLPDTDGPPDPPDPIEPVDPVDVPDPVEPPATPRRARPSKAAKAAAAGGKASS